MALKKISPRIATALITGASAGLGAEYARQLAQLGYKLVLTARRLDRLETLAAEMRKQHGVSVACIAIDLSEEQGIALLEKYIAAMSDLEILVNNAGFGLRGSFEQNEIGRTMSMIQVHVNATVRLTHAALPLMRRRDSGYVINVSSMSAFLPVRNVTYSATKAFLVNFSAALETDLYGSGIHIQALCPGFTYTEFHDTPELSNFKRSSLPGWLWMACEYVVRDSLDNLNSGRVIVVPGLQYKIAHYLARSPLFSSLLNLWVKWLLSRKTLLE